MTLPRSRLFELVTEQEWQAVNSARKEHADVTEAIEFLLDREGDGITPLRIVCPENLSHKKRMAAREQAVARGMSIKTKYSNGWLYMRRKS